MLPMSCVVAAIFSCETCPKVSRNLSSGTNLERIAASYGLFEARQFDGPPRTVPLYDFARVTVPAGDCDLVVRFPGADKFIANLGQFVRLFLNYEKPSCSRTVDIGPSKSDQKRSMRRW
jgi:hypothetical protein